LVRLTRTGFEISRGIDLKRFLLLLIVFRGHRKGHLPDEAKQSYGLHGFILDVRIAGTMTIGNHDDAVRQR